MSHLTLIPGGKSDLSEATKHVLEQLDLAARKAHENQVREALRQREIANIRDYAARRGFNNGLVLGFLAGGLLMFALNLVAA
jgi:hypothetical protein